LAECGEIRQEIQEEAEAGLSGTNHKPLYTFIYHVSLPHASKTLPINEDPQVNSIDFFGEQAQHGSEGDLA